MTVNVTSMFFNMSKKNSKRFSRKCVTVKLLSSTVTVASEMSQSETVMTQLESLALAR